MLLKVMLISSGQMETQGRLATADRGDELLQQYVCEDWYPQGNQRQVDFTDAHPNPKRLLPGGSDGQYCSGGGWGDVQEEVCVLNNVSESNVQSISYTAEARKGINWGQTVLSSEAEGQRLIVIYIQSASLHYSIHRLQYI